MSTVFANWSGDASELIRALSTLAWPIIVGAVIWRLRGELPKIAHRLRELRWGSAQATLDPSVMKLEEEAEEAESEVRQQLPAGSSGGHGRGDGGRDMQENATDSIIALAAQDPRLGVVKLVTEIEVRVRDLASITGHDNPQRVSWHVLVGWLVEQGTVPRRFAAATDLIRDSRNRIVHGRDRDLDDREVAATIDAGLRLLRVLEAIPDRGYEVREMVPIYRDRETAQEYEAGHGVVLWDFDAQGHHRDYRVHPTRNTYEPGSRVGWQWSFDRLWPEAYWRDPWDGDKVKLGWSESAEFVGQPLLRQGERP